MKYIKKQEPVEAIQFKDSSAETLNELIEFIGKEVTILFPDNTPMATWTYGRAYLNDWIIKEDNRIVVKTNKYFRENYSEDLSEAFKKEWNKYISSEAWKQSCGSWIKNYTIIPTKPV